MNKIQTKQNESKFINYLKAQRVAYSQSKLYLIIDVINIFIAISLPIISYFKPEAVSPFFVFSLIWVVIFLLFESDRNTKTKIAAKIQEQFDTELFELPWNNVLCKSKINADQQLILSQKYKGNDLVNWYSTEVDEILPIRIAVLFCQRINLSWDGSLKQKFKKWLTFFVTLYYGIFIIISIFGNTPFFEMLLIISPSAPFLIYMIKSIAALKKQIKSHEETKDQLDKYIDHYKKKKEVPTNTILRQFQDEIYTQRNISDKVPDWFYKLYKKNSEDTSNLIIKSKKEDF